jgi:hypothetical protein
MGQALPEGVDVSTGEVESRAGGRVGRIGG